MSLPLHATTGSIFRHLERHANIWRESDETTNCNDRFRFCVKTWAGSWTKLRRTFRVCCAPEQTSLFFFFFADMAATHVCVTGRSLVADSWLWLICWWASPSPDDPRPRGAVPRGVSLNDSHGVRNEPRNAFSVSIFCLTSIWGFQSSEQKFIQTAVGHFRRTYPLTQEQNKYALNQLTLFPHFLLNIGKRVRTIRELLISMK